jgi:hypothetical protein
MEKINTYQTAVLSMVPVKDDDQQIDKVGQAQKGLHSSVNTTVKTI